MTILYTNQILSSIVINNNNIFNDTEMKCQYYVTGSPRYTSFIPPASLSLYNKPGYFMSASAGRRGMIPQTLLLHVV